MDEDRKRHLDPNELHEGSSPNKVRRVEAVDDRKSHLGLKVLHEEKKPTIEYVIIPRLA